MNLRYYIVDDDPVSRRMLERIIEDSETGEVVGSSESGQTAIPLIISVNPDIVLIDLLMPDLDGIETMDKLKQQNYMGQFIMISQVVNKDMVGEAYDKGVDFFIHKPINRTEVLSILKKMAEQVLMRQSLLAIRNSLAGIEQAYSTHPSSKKASVKETILSIMNDMGIVGEAGCSDIIAILEFLSERQTSHSPFPALKDLYEAVASKRKPLELEVKKESKAIEQRVRRAIFAALNNLASLGCLDYANPKFEYYAPRYFEFQDVRLRMREIEAGEETTKAKLNIKKFLQVLYLETMEKMQFHS